MTDTLVLIAGLLADEAPKDTGPDFGKASPFGLLIVVLLLIGTCPVGAVDEPASQAPAGVVRPQEPRAGSGGRRNRRSGNRPHDVLIGAEDERE